MKKAYPIVITKDTDYYVVYIPDFNINTEGTSYADAMYMARDAIGLMGIVLLDEGKTLPEPSLLTSVQGEKNDVITLVDVDFDEYRRKNDMKTVRRNVTLPSWLDEEAKKSKINVSAVLQKALKNELNINP